MYYTVKNKKYKFPDNWNKQKVLKFVNTGYKTCPYCGKFDISLSHLNSCSGNSVIVRDDEYFK